MFNPSGRLLSSFGAVPDAELLYGVSIAPGSDILFHAGRGCRQEHVGKDIAIAYGIDQHNMLITTVAEWISDQELRLTAPAGPLAPTAPGDLIHQSATIYTDCSEAIQTFLNSITSKTGGMLLFDGSYGIGKGVYRNMADQGQRKHPGGVTLAGWGVGGVLRVACSPDVTAIHIDNGPIVTEELSIAGTPGAFTDAKSVIRTDVGGLYMRNTGVYGIMSRTGHSFTGTGSRFETNQAHFGGCSGDDYKGTSVVYFPDCAGADVQKTYFIDYGTLNEEEYSKTPLASAECWIDIPSATGPLNFQEMHLDEGAFHQIRLGAGSGAGTKNGFDTATIDRVRCNAWGISQGCIVAVFGKHFELTRSTMGFQRSPTLGVAVHLSHNKYSKVEAVIVGRDGTTVTKLDAINCDTVEVRNCEGFTKYHTPGTKDFSIDRKPGVLPRISSFKVQPVVDTLALDDATMQLRRRTAEGTWVPLI